jgi:regulator of extracellular matrix RemA (YlzA/DUF370 family)
MATDTIVSPSSAPVKKVVKKVVKKEPTVKTDPVAPTQVTADPVAPTQVTAETVTPTQVTAVPVVQIQDISETVTPEQVISETVTPEQVISQLSESFNIIQKETKNFQVLLKELKSVRQKELKMNNRKQKKTRRVANFNSQPHGFAKKTKLHPTLATFLGVTPETELSSPTVTSMIAKYIKAKGLATPENKSIFKCDEALLSILGESKFLSIKKKPELGNGYSFWNLQKLLKETGMFIRD